MTFFDRRAAAWDANPERLKLHKKLAQAVCRKLPLRKTWRCLDFGCGTGLAAFLLADRLGEIICLDFSAGMIQELNRKLQQPGTPGNLVSRCAALRENTFPGETFDFLFTILALHHIEDVASLIKIFAGIIKSGGYLAIIDLDREDGSFHKGSEVSVPHRGFARDYLEGLLRAAGFGDISSTTAAHYERRNEDGVSRFYPLFLISGKKI